MQDGAKLLTCVHLNKLLSLSEVCTDIHPFIFTKPNSVVLLNVQIKSKPILVCYPEATRTFSNITNPQTKFNKLFPF